MLLQRTAYRLNRGHPLAQGMHTLHLPGAAVIQRNQGAFGIKTLVDYVREAPLSRAVNAGTGDFGRIVESPWGPALDCNPSDSTTNNQRFLLGGEYPGSNNPLVIDQSEYTQLFIVKGNDAPINAHTQSSAIFGGNLDAGYIYWHNTVGGWYGHLRKRDSGATIRLIDFQVAKSIQADTWHHLVVKCSTVGTYMRTYLDGVFSEESANAPATVSASCAIVGADSSTPFSGAIFMYASWNRALSDAEIWSLYQNPTQILQRSSLPVFNLPSGQTVTVDLVDLEGSAQANLSSLKWDWFNESDPNSFNAPSDQGSAEVTDGTGELVLDLPNTTLTSGQTGFLVLKDDANNLIGGYRLQVD